MFTAKLNTANTCPVCESLLDGVTNLTEDSGPSAGDVSVCAYCATYLQFDDQCAPILMPVEQVLALPGETLYQLTRYRNWILKRLQTTKAKPAHAHNGVKSAR